MLLSSELAPLLGAVSVSRCMRTVVLGLLVGFSTLCPSGVAGPFGVAAQESSDLPQVVNAPKVFLGGVPFSLELQGATASAVEYEVRDAQGTVLGSGSVDAGATITVGNLVVSGRSSLPLTVRFGQVSEEVSRPFAPGWFSLAPPVVAILLALLFK